MKMFLLENESGSTTSLTDLAKTRKWSFTDFAFQLDDGEVDVRRFLAEVRAYRPDVVIIDIALSADEESRISDVVLDVCSVAEDEFSGFRYCQALVRERWGTPVVFLTKIGSANVVRTAMRIGADRVILKDDSAGDILAEIEELVKCKAAHDPDFYWELQALLEADQTMWQRETMSEALRRFYLNPSPVRRLGLLSASLREVLSVLLRGDSSPEKALLLRLVRSQAVLSVIDPELRDHVKHTGNVFWMGYRLLHEIEAFRSPRSLPGCFDTLYVEDGSLSPWDQLMYAWTLASLFHDYGYVDEKGGHLVDLVSCLLPGARITSPNVRGEGDWSGNMRELRDYVKSVVGDAHFLYYFINEVSIAFGSERDRRDKTGGGKSVVLDHGFLGAHRLLSLVPLSKIAEAKKRIVLHAALAIACHNYVDLNRKWNLGDDCLGEVDVGTFPVCALLAFVDSVQTWDRETSNDPVLHRTGEQDRLMERLIMSDAAFVSGSELRRFSVSPLRPGGTQELGVELGYFVDPSGNAKEVCEDLDDRVQGWINSEKLTELCRRWGISSVLTGEITYHLPMMYKSRQVVF